MGKLRTIKNRIYADYIMPSRLGEYRRLLETSIDLGYKHLSVIDFHQLLEKNSIDIKQRYFVHRHDIDTDVRTAKKMFAIEKKLDIRVTYYFRLSTVDYDFMREIDEYGSEASYHFEELASYCKLNHIKSKKQALENINEIKLMFKRNVEMIAINSNIEIKSVASHGDFVNRALGVINNVITDDLSLRKELGIECETYDKALMNAFDIYISDKPYPVYYSPISAFEALTSHKSIYMISHPRQWETNWAVNTVDNIRRLIEGIKW